MVKKKQDWSNQQRISYVLELAGNYSWITITNNPQDDHIILSWEEKKLTVPRGITPYKKMYFESEEVFLQRIVYKLVNCRAIVLRRRAEGKEAY